MFLLLGSYPFKAKASLFSIVTGFFGTSADASANSDTSTPNSQDVSLLKAATNIDPNPSKPNQMPVIVDDSSILAEVDPMGNSTSTAGIFDSSQITTYVVRAGDTLPQIAKTFGITDNTIMIANDLTSSKLTEGQHLIILPVSGIEHTVKSGETLTGIAKAYKVSAQDILQYNHFENNSLLAVGDQIFIPSDVLPVRSAVTPRSGGSGSAEPLLGAPLLDGASAKGLVDITDYFMEPLSSYKKTQGLHGHNAVDLAAPIGTPIMAAAAGEVIISRMGWNGGYGNYVVIQHDNGTQTLYAHSSKLMVAEGEEVNKGQTIALVGSTGDSTGPHLHVEVRGGKNPF